MQTKTETSDAREPRPEKVAVVAEVRARFESADAALLTEYRGLTVTELATLRRSLREAGTEFKVYKNTLVRRAASEAGLEGVDSILTGPTAIAFVTGDAAVAAKTLRDFARTSPALIVKGGLLGTRFLSPADASALAELPSRDVLLAKLAGGLAAPMQRFAGLLQALPRNFAYGLSALIEKGGAPGAPAAAPEAEAPAEAEASTTEAPETTPTEAPEAAPVDVPEPTPTEAPEPAPVDVPEPTPTDAPDSAPAEAPEATPEAPAAPEASAPEEAPEAPATPEAPSETETPDSENNEE